MEKEEVKCKNNQRLFDVYDRSQLIIRFKCKNRKCKYKSLCDKEELLHIGELKNEVPLDFIPQRCPVCNHIALEATSDSCGKVQIKCTNCKQTSDIPIGDVKKTAFAA
jgi:hypothetical protein